MLVNKMQGTRALNEYFEGALLNTILTDVPDMAAAFYKLRNDVVQQLNKFTAPSWSKALTEQAKQLRRQNNWIAASSKFEAAGQYYSAMYCLHKAIDLRQGVASDHYHKLAGLYRTVGRTTRAKRYVKYSDYELVRENRAYAKDYLQQNGLNKTMPQFERDVGEMMSDDHETFARNIEEYKKDVLAQAAEKSTTGLLCSK